MFLIIMLMFFTCNSFINNKYVDNNNNLYVSFICFNDIIVYSVIIYAAAIYDKLTLSSYLT